ncbi:MAG: hypothetical protein Q7K34_04765 [archaeon]|nr:hypothetical protein [archaeon]
MPGPIRRFVQGRKARKRLGRVVAAERKTMVPQVHADQLELRGANRKLASGQRLLRTGNRVYGGGSFLAGSGMAELGGMAAVAGGALRAAGHVRTAKAQEGIARATKAIIDRRLGKETQRQRIARRLAGKPKKRNLK